MKKINKIKKTLSVLLVTLMIIMTLPASVSAVGNTTNNTVVYPGDKVIVTYSFAKDIPAGCKYYYFEANCSFGMVKYSGFKNRWVLHPRVDNSSIDYYKKIPISGVTIDNSHYGPKVKRGEKIISIVYDVIKKAKVSDLNFSLIELNLGINNQYEYLRDLSYISYDVSITSKGGKPVKPTTVAPTTTKPTTVAPTTVTPTTAISTTEKPTKVPTTVPIITQPITAPVTEPSAEYLLGDVDNDALVTVMDATLVQKYIVGMETLSTKQKQLADVNRDNQINVVDATCIQSYVVGLSTFPSTSPSNTNATEPVEAQPTTRPMEVKATKPVKTTQPTTAEKTTTQVVAATAPTTTLSNISSNNNNSFNDKYAKEVLNIVNKERTKNGLEPLVSNNTLNEIAKTRATEIVTSFSHSRPDGSSCFSAINKYNIRWRTLGENIAGGYKSPSSVMNAWMNSDGHRANILNKDFESVGIACYNYNGTYYWVQFFMGEFHK